MYDLIEMMEASAERVYFDQLQPDGRMKCYCGEIYDEKDAMPASGSPYAAPVCPKCYNKMVEEAHEFKNEK